MSTTEVDQEKLTEVKAFLEACFGLSIPEPKHGAAQDMEAFELLRRVTHWSEDDVSQEKTLLSRRTVKPTCVLKHSFAELLDLFHFVAY